MIGQTAKSLRKTTQLKNMFESPKLSFLMEAHNGLSAKIVEEAGFSGIWASGLSISASLGLRDNNEASWSQVVDVAEYMADATQIPILIDGDTGHGNFNNMRRFVKKLEQRGVAGVCIEDKIFPKTNSFLRDGKQELARIDEFCGKIKAGLDSRNDNDFCVVARIEAFIAGWGLEEALKRAHAYADAGANAILVHSKLSRPDEIFAFMREWKNRCPVVIVPTKYYATPTKDFEKNGISTIIWANHNMRASLKAMQEVSKQIFQTQTLVDVEDRVSPLNEVFRLQNDQELMLAEEKYLARFSEAKGIILAAGQGKELGELTKDRPKAMLPIQGRPLIQHTISHFHQNNVEDVIVVRGYKKESFTKLECRYIDNDQFETTKDLSSLYLAKEELNQEAIIGYGDTFFRSFILNQLRESQGDIVLVVDSLIEQRKSHYTGDFVRFHGLPNSVLSEGAYLTQMELQSFQAAQLSGAQGEWIGLWKVSEKGAIIVKTALEELYQRPEFATLTLSDLFQYLIKRDVKISIAQIHGHWMDIDTLPDYEQGQIF